MRNYNSKLSICSLRHEDMFSKRCESGSGSGFVFKNFAKNLTKAVDDKMVFMFFKSTPLKYLRLHINSLLAIDPWVNPYRRGGGGAGSFLCLYWLGSD